MVAWMGRTALELMGQGGLGHSFDPLVADAGDDYGKALKDLMCVAASRNLTAYGAPRLTLLRRLVRPTLAQVHGLHHWVPLFQTVVPKIWQRTLVELIPSPPLKRILQIVNTMRTRSTQIFEAKKKALLAGDEALKHLVGEGRDLISVLRAFSTLGVILEVLMVTRSMVIVKANMEASEEDKLPEDELIGQMSYVFIIFTDHTCPC